MIKVGITIGDINGVGLETILQVFSDQRMSEIVTPIVYGQVDVLRETRKQLGFDQFKHNGCLLYTSPSPRDRTRSRMPSSA